MELNLEAIYIIWLREIKKYFRAKERIIGSLTMPLFWFLIFGVGLGSSINFQGLNVNYSSFLAPGIITMTLLFTSIFSGISVIWDREFGFLKEILVAPVSRLSIVIGRSLGGATTAVFQGMIVLCLFMLISLKVNILSILTVIPVMLMISLGFVTLGITIASLLENVEGFQLIMNFIVQPMFFLSGAFFPLQNLPQWLRGVTFLDPMTYGVETMRYVLIGFSSMPIYTSLGVVLLFAGITSIIGSYTFSRRQ